MSNLDLTKILSKKYKELPEKKKVGTLNEHLTGFFFIIIFFSSFEKNFSVLRRIIKICFFYLAQIHSGIPEGEGVL